VSVSALAGNDSFQWNAAGQVGGKFAVNLGGGSAQTVLVNGGTNGLSIGKGLGIDTSAIAASAANITLSKIGVGGSSKVKTGSGVDVIVIDDSQFLGAVSIETNAGADEVKIEKAASTGISRFLGPVKISLGVGDDKLSVSTNAVANDATRFAVKWFADGGAGTNTATLGAANIFDPFGKLLTHFAV
jgi:hypothetical protein